MTNKTEDKFYFGKPGQPDVMATPMGEHGAIGKLVSRAIQEGAAAYRAGKPAVLNALDPKYKGMSEKELEIYGNFWMRGWDGERIKDASAKPIGRGIDFPGMRFSRPGQPERFGLEDACWEGYEPVGTKQKDGRTVPNCVPKDKNEQPEEFAAQIVSKRGAKRTEIKRDAAGKWAAVLIQSNPTGVPGERADEQVLDMKWYATEANARTAAQKMLSARPGQPERFAANGWQTIEAYMQVLAEEFGTPRGKEAAQVMMRAAESLGGNAPAALRTAIRTAATSKNATDRGRAIGQIEDMLESASFSRPGQPDKFDASSLNRGTFAEASTSPMLGKLLSEKVMPEGGWRAVQVGSDTLVISFEDADLASDFGRRVATKGYNATSPVQAIGRYWNVEVKNGK